MATKEAKADDDKEGKAEAPASSTPQGELTNHTFAVELWDCFDKVYRRVSKGRHDLKHLKAYLDTRQKLEVAYGTELKKASALAEFAENSSLSKCWADMRDTGAQLAKQHTQFGQTCLEVSAVLEKAIHEIKTSKGKLREKYVKLEKDRATRGIAHQKARDVYVESVKQAETSVINRDAGRSQNFPDKQMTKLEQTMKGKMKDVENSDSAYKKCVTALKEAQAAFDTQVFQILQQFEELERKRLTMLQEQVQRFSTAHDFMKGAMTQMSLILVKSVGEISVPRDIQEFITKNTIGKKPTAHVQYIQCNSEILNHALGGAPPVRKEPEQEKKVTVPSPPATTREEPKKAVTPAVVTPSHTPAAPAVDSPASGIKWGKAGYEFASSEPDDLSFPAGAIIKLLSSPDAEEWWHGELNGKQGMFPKTYVDIIDNPTAGGGGGGGGKPAAAVAGAPDAPEPEAAPSPPGGPVGAAAVPHAVTEIQGEVPKLMNAECQALFDFDGQDADELSFKQGETLVITGELNGWFLGKTQSGDRVGIFPSNYVKLGAA